MASFCFLLLLIIAFAASPLLSLASQPSSETSTISASPAFSTNSPPTSPLEDLPPDIAPLLPSPGGVVPTTGTSSVPTIPSSPSPPNPDEFDVLGPSASAPFMSLPDSLAIPRTMVGFMNLAISAGCVVLYSTVQLLRV